MKSCCLELKASLKESVDGFGEESLWTFEGLAVAIGVIDDNGNHVLGSGIMVASVLLLTATHVIDETKHGVSIANSFLNENNMRTNNCDDLSIEINEKTANAF